MIRAQSNRSATGHDIQMFLRGQLSAVAGRRCFAQDTCRPCDPVWLIVLQRSEKGRRHLGESINVRLSLDLYLPFLEGGDYGLQGWRYCGGGGNLITRIPGVQTLRRLSMSTGAHGSTGAENGKRRLSIIG